MRLHIARLVSVYFMLSLSCCVFAQYDKDAFYYRGRQALSDGRYAASIENFNILASLDTTDHLTYFFRGIAKYNLGDIRGARKDFDRTVALNPVFTSGYHYRAITESQSGEYDKALEDYDTAIMLRPGYEGIYYSRGVTYFLARQFEDAVRDFDWYIRREPRDPSAYLNRGACHLYLQDTLKALSDYDKAISLDRYEPEGYIRRGRLHASRGDSELALADMDRAVQLDSTNTLAYFYRALLRSETRDLNNAMADLDKVLELEPGNALTLYNRSLLHAQVGDYEEALNDMDRVIGINPGNVLAYFNRASFFIEMERWRDALEDYDRAIELYPDFAKAYQNRSYVENMLGMTKESKRDYETAMRKVREYQRVNEETKGSFADTTRKYSSLLAFDADFAKRDFDDELLQHRDIDIRLKPLYRFAPSAEKGNVSYALSRRYENVLLDRFISDLPLPVSVTGGEGVAFAESVPGPSAGDSGLDRARLSFLKALDDVSSRRYSSAMQNYGLAVDESGTEGMESLYAAFYLMNRAVLRADMIDFISSMESNVQTLSMDDKGVARARVAEQVTRSYDYSEAVADLEKAVEILPDLPYLHYDLGNLFCLSSRLVESIDSYSRAIELYPAMGDAYYNRGLVLIYLKDKDKGCIDLSRAGELGVADAYGVINRYCTENND